MWSLVVLGLLGWVLVPERAGALEPEDLLQMKWIDVPSLSPDGRWVAFTVFEPVAGPEESVDRSHVRLAALDGSEGFQLTQGPDAFAPAFSPDGGLVAFLSARDGDDKPELWLIHPDGGEAWRLTGRAATAAAEGAGGAGRFRWAPDGKSIAFVRREPLSAERQAAVKAKDDARVVERDDVRFHHLWRVAVDPDGGVPGDGEPVLHRLTAGDFDVADFDWSPDSRRLVVVHHPNPRLGAWRSSDLSLVSADGLPDDPGDDDGLVPLVRHPGMDTGARFSPDGRAVAFVSDRGHRTWARDWVLCTVPVGEDGATSLPEVTVLPPTADGMPQSDFIDGGVIGWSSDGSGVYYYELEGTSTHLYFMPVAGRTWRRMTELPGEKFFFSLRRDGRTVAFVSGDFERPYEVWTQELPERLATGGEAGPARQVSHVHAGIAPLPEAASEEVRWRSFDGLEIEGVLHLPPGYREGERVPLLVELHGGPTWGFQRSYAFDARLMGEHGFAVLQVNPRGSDGYGRDFRLANLGDWGGKDVRDVLAGVDHVIGTGVADPERLGVFGWSYGGFLTGQTIAHSRRFGAAIVGAGPSHLVSADGTTDIEGFNSSFMESEFWQEPDLWRDRSTVYHAGEITTPTLILHGEEDLRVPVSQGYELHRALKRAGVPVEMVVYPRAGHGLGEPKFRVDEVKRRLAWFERWLGREGSGPRGRAIE